MNTDGVPERQRKALLAGIASYAAWGFFPIYWKLLARLPSPEILAHRMIWACVFYMFVYVWQSRRSGSDIFALIRQSRRQWIAALLSAAVLALNWGIYIYAVKSGQIVQGSLAYFINPLMNVAVGVLFFRENFPRILKIACAFAAAGVLIQVAFAAIFPWIALTLATTFCSYGVVKKTLKIQPELSSAMEGLVAFVPALLAAWFLRQGSDLAILPEEWFLLIGSGIVTGLPLLLFSIAAQRIPYSLLGMLQFIAPSLQFIVGILIYGERLDVYGILSFALIWTGAGFYFWHLLRENFVKRGGRL